jgi:hypothetical protein
MQKSFTKALSLMLALHITFGLWGAFNVSYDTLTGKAYCPKLFNIPVCYLVSIGYLLMLLPQLFSSLNKNNKVFYSGWGLVFVIAIVGVSFELTIGHVCPTSKKDIPLCYLSFAYCVLIMCVHWLRLRLKICLD